MTHPDQPPEAQAGPLEAVVLRSPLPTEGWKVWGHGYVLGWRCPCGRLWLDFGPYAPWPPAPRICGSCGAPRNKWEPRSLLRVFWERKRHWFLPKEERCTHDEGIPR